MLTAGLWPDYRFKLVRCRQARRGLMAGAGGGDASCCLHQSAAPAPARRPPPAVAPVSPVDWAHREREESPTCRSEGPEQRRRPSAAALACYSRRNDRALLPADAPDETRPTAVAASSELLSYLAS